MNTVREYQNNQITLSNALTRAGCTLTLAEKRIVMLAVSKLNPLKPPPVQLFVTKITAIEYAVCYDLDTDTAYSQLRSASKSLYSRTLTFFTPAHKRKGQLEYLEINMRWIGRATYHKNEGWIELAWWFELLPHLMGLKAQFTQYQLKQATALRSIYSWRLLELLARFKSNGWAEYTIEDFCLSMQATDKQRSNFNNIKRRIIEPAVKELVEKDGWSIEWYPIKAGRKVKSVRFEFKS